MKNDDLNKKPAPRAGPRRLDGYDRKILTCLQRDATMPIAAIAQEVGLSTTPCWHRIQKLEKAGVIRERVALLDPAKVNLGVTVFVAIRTDRHDIDWLEKFSFAVREFPEVIEFYRMAGDMDYLLRVVVPDIAAFDAFYKKLIARVPIYEVTSRFAMEQIKYTTMLPLDQLLVR